MDEQLMPEINQELIKKALDQAIKMAKIKHYHITKNGNGFLSSNKSSIISPELYPELFEYLKQNSQ